MILFILPLIALAVPTIVAGLDYLFKLLFPPAPDTVPLSEPYTPPYTGGQCVGVTYSVAITVSYTFNGSPVTEVNQAGNYIGKITEVSVKPVTANQFSLTVKYNNGTQTAFFAGWYNSPSVTNLTATSISVTPLGGAVDNCGNLPNPNPSSPIGGNGLPSSPPPVLYPPPNSPPNTPPTTPNNNWFPLIAGIAAIAATALTAATAAAAATAATAVTAATAAATAATAAIASAPSGSTTQQQAQSQKLSADALVGIAQVLAEVAKQIAELEKETRKLKTDEAKKEKDDAKKVIRYDFGSANRDGFIKLYPESNPDGFEATFVDVQIFNIPLGSGKYFGEKSPHYYKYKSLGQVHFVSPTFGILESREIDFARLSLNVPDNCFGFFYHFGLNGIVSANLSCFYTKTEKQAV